MKKKKPNPIDKHKEKDLIELREYLFGIVRDKEQHTKDRNEASKQLLRLHKALQPEKITEKPASEKKEFSSKKPAIRPEVQSMINNLKKANAVE